jgi:hypothetical protein
MDLALEGWLVNKLPVWGLLAMPATAPVRDVDQTPYVKESSDPELRES